MFFDLKRTKFFEVYENKPIKTHTVRQLTQVDLDFKQYD